MPIITITDSNVKWTNLYIRIQDRHLTQALPNPFRIVNAAGEFICDATLQMDGARLSAPALYAEQPPAHLPLGNNHLQVGDSIHWHIQNGDFIIDEIVAGGDPRPANNLPALAVPQFLEVSASALREVGFHDLAVWEINRPTGLLQYRDIAPPELVTWGEWKPSLYAHVEQDCVRYIGKTRRSLRQRMDDYRRGLGDQTNRRIHNHIKETLEANRVVTILGFNPSHSIHWGRFKINIPAGLEDVMIDYFQPDWNAI